LVVCFFVAAVLCIVRPFAWWSATLALAAGPNSPATSTIGQPNSSLDERSMQETIAKLRADNQRLKLELIQAQQQLDSLRQHLAASQQFHEVPFSLIPPTIPPDAHGFRLSPTPPTPTIPPDTHGFRISPTPQTTIPPDAREFKFNGAPVYIIPIQQPSTVITTLPDQK
jgi:hypothetical protein